MVQINYVSDIHLEFYKKDCFDKMFHFPDNGEILCLAGDIGYPQHDNYNKFIKYCSDKFKYVVMIAGNHEYYMKEPIDYVNELIVNVCSQYNNVIFLNNSTYYFEEYNLYIVGSTLWTDIRQLTNYDVIGYNDFHRIKSMHIEYMNKLHDDCIKFLSNELERLKSLDSKVIVMTHHLPSYKMIHNKYKGSPLTPLFANNMDDYFEKYKIDIWICGHSHAIMNEMINKTQILLNPMGYPGEIYKTRPTAYFLL
jgi:predicted phosphohydrolase